MYQLYLWDPVEPGQKPQCNLPADEKYCNETQYPYKPYRECVFILYDFCCVCDVCKYKGDTQGKELEQCIAAYLNVGLVLYSNESLYVEYSQHYICKAYEYPSVCKYEKQGESHDYNEVGEVSPRVIQ